MAKKGTTPRGSSPPRATKVTKAEQPGSTQQDKPLFSFERTLRGGDERWRYPPSAEDAVELLLFLAEMAQLTWAEIERAQTGGHGNRHRKHHDQELESLCPEAREDLLKAKLDVIFGETIFRFRLSGEKRLWGFRVGRTFHVVMWDPGHEVCPVDR
jgi:hypothetical protein